MAIKDALALAAAMLPRRQAVVDRAGNTANYLADDRRVLATLRKINHALMEGIGIVSL
jgi:hypothetical protein